MCSGVDYDTIISYDTTVECSLMMSVPCSLIAGKSWRYAPTPLPGRKGVTLRVAWHRSSGVSLSPNTKLDWSGVECGTKHLGRGTPPACFRPRLRFSRRHALQFCLPVSFMNVNLEGVSPLDCHI